MSAMLKCLVLLSVVGMALSTKCHGHDTSMCMGLNCTNMGEVVGCEHDTCTCVSDNQNGGHATLQACADKPDCMNLPGCKHGEDMHCIDKFCQCAHLH